MENKYPHFNFPNRNAVPIKNTSGWIFNIKHSYLIIAMLLFLSRQDAIAQSTTFNYSGSVASYTVPAGVTMLTISASGAQGGNITWIAANGGNGATMTGNIPSTPGDVLNIMVGQQPFSTLLDGAGGGGSFVWDVTTGNVLQVAAGGGGGASIELWFTYGGAFLGAFTSFNGLNASTTTNGVNGGNCVTGAGSGGNGSVFPTGMSYGVFAAGGAGWLSNGTGGNGPTCGNAVGGSTPLSGGAGGAYGGIAGQNSNGGYGGGGGAQGYCSCAGGGGGGGYSGGGGGGLDEVDPGFREIIGGPGGGGGSYVIGTGTVTASSVTSTGNGKVTICAWPYAGVILGGGTAICQGTTFTLSDATSTGSTSYTWSSSNTAVATVDAVAGIVGGVGAGTATITYTATNTCGNMTATTIVTVFAAPGSINGTQTICGIGNTTTLTDGTAGGTWSSSNVAVGSIALPSSGTVTAVSGGTTTITYSLGGSCYSTAIVTVSPAPGVINGTTSVCTGLTTTLTDGTAGGTWSSTTTTVGTVGSTTGTVGGISAGTTTISYTTGVACYSTTTVTVTSTPGAITGTETVCTGSTTSLTNAVAGGTWTSSNTAVGTIGSTTGVVAGLSSGTTNITYSMGATCYSAITVTVYATPSAILGNDNVCTTTTTLLSDAVAGGTWSSSSGNATVGSTTGLVSGVTAGTATITYSTGGSCYVTTTVTVYATPGGIIGSVTVCQLGTISLAEGTAGGTWSASNGNVTLGSCCGSPVLVTGVSAGTVVVSYSMGGGACYSIKTITVTGIPGPITGTTLICTGFTTNLTDGTAGGNWSSSNPPTATVGALTGVVTGGATLGTATITYSTGCAPAATIVVTVTSAPTAILGTYTVCPGATTTLTDATIAGTWSSSNVAVGTVGSVTGIVGGIAGGTTTISYTTTCGSVTQVITVNVSAVAGTISGPTTVCPGSTITLTDATASGGTGAWSSSAPGIGSVDPVSGIVTGISAGTTMITYTVTSATCGFVTATYVVTVNAAPFAGAITGLSSVCVGSTITLNNGTASGGTGTWSSSNPGIGTVGAATGVVGGISVGVTTITYTETSVSCGTATTTTNITVNVSPTGGTITGPTTVCTGLTITLTDATASGGAGAWSSSAPGVGSIDPVSGIVTGIASGTTMITYTITSASCGTATATYIITVNVSPFAGAISGLGSVCVGATDPLTNPTASGGTGTWSSSNPGIGTVGSVTGVVGGISVGVTTITYTETSVFCGTATTTTNITVNVSPTGGTITGPATVCTGLTITLTDATASGGAGAWSSSNPGVGTVGAITGVVGGIASGTTMITYTVTSASCGTATATYIVTVNVSPFAGAITGLSAVCVGSTITLNNGTASGGTGTWSSSNPGIGTVGSATGVVGGISVGVTTITYTETSISCGTATTTTNITVNVSPIGGTITGPTTVCTGLTITLTDATASGGAGAWSSSAPGIGSIDPVSGIVTGIASGTTMITYTISSASCGTVTATYIVTVNASPFAGAITGASSVCVGGTDPLTNLTASGGTGTWSSSNPGIGTVGSATGVVGGISVGVTTITYTETSVSCGSATTTTNITVNVSPIAGAITGPTTVCTGLTITLTDATASGGVGAWSSSNPGIGTVGASTGVVGGIASGTTMITYAISSASCGTVTATYIVTVNVSPFAGAITGASSVCVGATDPLTNLTASGGTGTWSSSNPGIGTVGSATGVVGGISVGVTTITYTETSVSCGSATTTMNITVNVSPIAGAITGPTTVCTGLTITLTDATASGGAGTWSSSNPGVGTVGVGTGVVGGIASGTTMVTYTVTSASCGTVTATYIVTVNVSPFAGAITGLSAVCVGSTITLNNGTASGGTGTWSSSNPGIGTIGSATGVVGGISVGVTTITYTETSVSCGIATTTTNITVNVSPIAGAITGPTTVCTGLTITLTDATASGGAGTWSSSNPGVGTVGVGTGVVGGIASGTTMITYTVTSASCGTVTATYIVTVNVSPFAGAITGLSAVCVGSTITLNNGTASGGIGTWSSSNPGIGTIGSATGVVGGISVGVTTITYTETSVSCGTATTTTNITVNVSPIGGTITGPTTVCTGLTITLTDATASGGTGTWSSSAPGVGSVDPVSGIVTGITAGTTMITYTVTSASCGTATATYIVTVNVSPFAGTITGLSAVCVGSTITLNNGTASGGTGTWSSSNPGIGTIGSATGVVGGISVGVTTITYTETSVSCGIATTTTNITVNVSPIAGAITGPTTVCTGLTITLTDVTASGGAGTWSSSNPGVGTVGVGTGVVGGIASGTTMITYTVTSASCGSATATYIVTVNVSPFAGAITGLSAICVGSTITLNNGTASGGTGTWSSSNPGIGTIGSATGVVGGISVGVTTITFTETSAFCGIATTTTNITVNVSPTAGTIAGSSSVCVGANIVLTDVTGSGGIGAWSSSTPPVGSVNSITGIVTGVSSGTTTITYTVTSASCGSAFATYVVTVNANPTAIGGVMSVCVLSTTTLNSTPAGGTWSSASGLVIVGSSSGTVTGVSSGTATIIYELPTTCYITGIVTVNPLPSAITGTMNVCVGSFTSLTDAGGGTWAMTNGNATVTLGTGIVFGVTAGLDTVIYVLPTSCTTTAVVTINPLPGTITGTLTVCSGLTTTLTDTPTGGTWSSSATGIATVGSTTGVVTGGALLIANTVTITYTLLTGCIATTTVTVNPLPGTINGTKTVCIGLTTSLTDASGGGTWSSSNTVVGTVGSVTGIVTGILAGTTIITYTLPTGCIATAIVTVNSLPGAITGTLTVCAGLTTTLSDTPPGGTWSSSATGIATVGSTTGIVTGGSVLVTSTATITYAIGTGCIMTAVVTVNPLPGIITGTMTVCAGLTTTLTDVTAGGTWSSSNTAVGTVGSTTGFVYGVNAGTTTVSYTLLTTGCLTTAVVTVNPLPANITGVFAVCSGSTTALTDAGGGTWTSSSPGIGSVGLTTGIVAGTGAFGTTTITYTLPTTCITTTVVTVNPLPGIITGTFTVCPGLTTQLTDATTGGTWSSSATGIATVDITTGLVTGGSAGTATITYTLPTGCFTTAVVTVNPLPGAILGTLSVCQGLTTSLSDITPSGTWSSSNSSVASISATGLVTGTATGSLALTATITYTLPTSCISTAVVTVNPLPASITGTMTVCSGLTTTLSDATAGGTWSISSTVTGSIGSTTGTVLGGTAGTTTVTYKLPTGCISTAIITVNPLPASITGTMAVCVGLTTTLSDITPSGTWSSSNPGIGSVGSTSGIVTGVSGGNIIVTYMIPTGCISTAIVTVNPLPAAITGTLNVCIGLTTDLGDTPAGGTWSSSNGNATIGALTGIVRGSVVGTSTITYTLPTGCIMTAIATVNPLPATITGTMNVCVGYTTYLSDASPGGTWSTSDTHIATAGSSTGGITGVSAGIVTVTYTLPTGCIMTTLVTVNPVPAPIAGTLRVCFRDTTYLSDITPGGVWSSSNPGIGSVGTSGMVIGEGVGTATISYTLAAGCSSMVVVTVNPLPLVFNVIHDSSYCQGGAGVPIGLTGSQVGVSYLLYFGPSAAGFLAGTGTPLTFGLMTAAGTYTVRATDVVTGCISNMLGSAIVTIIPTVNPMVSITTGVGDSVCPGTIVTLNPIPVHGGTLPTYTWSVNNVLVSTGSAYTFIPADGDVITVVMTSNGVCVMPSTAKDTLKIRVLPDAAPMVDISIDPGDTVCQYAAATFTATPTFGGVTPTYIWYVNGTQQVGSGPIFSYYPTTGDVVYCKMISDYKCRTADTGYSNVAVMTITPMIVPHVEVIGTLGLDVRIGEYDTLRAIATNAGPHPTYQWKINGVPVIGATSSTFVSQFNNYDSVTCVVTSSGVCDGISTFDWVYITVHADGVQQYTAGSGDIRLMPNPNNGVFTLKGTLGMQISGTNEDVTVEVTDMIGQVVYKNKLVIKDGKINEQLRMNNLVNGMYLLNLRSGDNNRVFHFVVEQ